MPAIFDRLLRFVLGLEPPPPEADPVGPGRIVSSDDDARWRDLTQMVVAYSTAVGRHGPASYQAHVIREKYADVPGFTELADALDRIKWRLGGSGVDWPADTGD